MAILNELKNIFEGRLDPKISEFVKARIKKKEGLYQLILKLNEFLISDDLDRKKGVELLKKLNSFRSNLVLDLYEAALFLRVYNKGRALRILRSIWKREKDFYALNSFPLGDKRSFYSELKISQTLLPYLKTNLNNEDATFTFTYLRDLWPDKEEVQDYYKDFSLQDIRNFSRSYKKGARFPVLWRGDLATRSANKDILKFMEQVWEYNFEIGEFYDVLWTLEFHTPAKAKIREKMIQEVSLLSKSNEPRDKVLFVKILGNEDIYNFLKRRDIVKRPLFLLKRTIYKEIYEHPDYKSYGAFNLFIQGDKVLENGLLGLF